MAVHLHTFVYLEELLFLVINNLHFINIKMRLPPAEGPNPPWGWRHLVVAFLALLVEKSVL